MNIQLSKTLLVESFCRNTESKIQGKFECLTKREVSLWPLQHRISSFHTIFKPRVYGKDTFPPSAWCNSLRICCENKIAFYIFGVSVFHAMKKNSGFVTNICIWLERFLRFKLFHCIFKCILTITAIRQSMHFFPTNLTLNLKQPFYIHINRFSGASVVEEERVSISNAFRHARIIVQFLSKKQISTLLIFLSLTSLTILLTMT